MQDAMIDERFLLLYGMKNKAIMRLFIKAENRQRIALAAQPCLNRLE